MKVWRTLCSLLLCACPCIAGAQSALWRHFDERPMPNSYKEIKLSTQGEASLRALLVPRLRRNEDCQPEDIPPNYGFRVSRIHLAATPVTLVESSCNGSPYFVRWLVAWNGPQPHLIAPSKDLYCWFDSVQQHAVDGFHDFTMGCHDSSISTNFAWYRFDGARYLRIATATEYKRGEEDNAQIAKDRQGCEENHIYCFWSNWPVQ